LEHTLLLPVELAFDDDYLISLNEMAQATLKVGVFSGEHCLGQKSFSLSLNAYASWTGLKLLPQTLACHVTPEQPLIHRFLIGAEKRLAGLPGAHALNGYAECAGVRMQLAAIFAAIAQEGISLNKENPDYNSPRQPIAQIDAILYTKKASALELALFYVSCLEAAGLNPLLVFNENRVFVGCWLEDKLFPESVQNDCHLLGPRVFGENPEILLIDPAAIAVKGSDPFVKPENLSLDGEDLLIVDIARARLCGVLPQPQRKQLPDGSYACVQPRPVKKGAPSSNSEYPMLELWENELLDLTMGNPLLDMRGDTSLQILPGQLSRLVDSLLEGSELTIGSAPETLESDGSYMHSFLDAAQTQERLDRLYKLSVAAQKDKLRPTLYLAAGFLRWYESDADERPRLAPLALFPAELICMGKEGYRFRLRPEHPVFNQVLLLTLDQRFGIEIDSRSLFQTDGKSPHFQIIHSAIRQAIFGMSRWSVMEHVFLGLFDCCRFELWEDLKQRAGESVGGSVAQSFLTGKISKTPPREFPALYELDSRYLPSDLSVPLSADASQLRAVCAAGEGGSFILSGPAGSGKTQTIVNIAANMLGRGKRVLILSGTGAPLEDALARLEAIGLGPFCLNYWEGAPGSGDIRPALEKLLRLGRIKHRPDYRERAEALGAMRQDLDTHMETLHKKQPGGFRFIRPFLFMRPTRTLPTERSFQTSCPAFSARKIILNGKRSSKNLSRRQKLAAGLRIIPCRRSATQSSAPPFLSESPAPGGNTVRPCSILSRKPGVCAGFSPSPISTSKKSISPGTSFVSLRFPARLSPRACTLMKSLPALGIS